MSSITAWTTALLVTFSYPIYAHSTPEVYPWSGEQTVLATESWLRLQREGQAASAHPQTMTLAEQEKIMARWLDSYQHPLPDFFEQDIGGSLSR
ncbi:MAG: DUF3613 domain-containing protein [Candidatus Oceanisphaera merdipullorum]|nr:DUF3613 domain-containing protein [Candidatus Oceanisphaera merdipullorum]